MKLVRDISVTSGALRIGPAFTPARLFAGGEAGVWFDPSDLTTLFQDSAGTTPVTAAGQPVGKVLDKSGRGNHATQATAASRPTYGVVPFSGRRNLLTYTEQLDNGVWIKAAASVVANAALAPDGTMTADKLVENTATGTHNVAQTYTAASGSLVAYAARLKAAERSWVRITVNTVSGANASAYFDLANGVVGSIGGGSALMVSAGDGWWWCIVIGTLTTANPSCSILIATGNGGQSYTGDGVSGILYSGAQVEIGAAATAYQKVVSAFDVTEAGVKSLSYLAFDGVDDFLETPTITPGADKVQVFAGVRKLADATGVIVEHSASSDANNGAAHLAAVLAGTANRFTSKGTVGVEALASGAAAPVSLVLAGLGDIAGDTATLRSNGVQVAQATSDQGTGNYLAAPIYIGRRGGTTQPFNGRNYGSIVRFGASLSGLQVELAERWFNTKTGAF